MPDLIVHNLSRIAYQDALEIQQALVARAQAGADEPAHLLLLEHDPPAITLGRRGRDDDILAAPEVLAARGVEIHRSQRGGEVTYHGPGQLVAYPIVRLDPRRRTVHAYVHALEDAVIRTLARFGVQGHRREGIVGIWSTGAKVAAIGVAVSRWVTYHGLALNVTPEASRAFDLIVPCGRVGGGAVTSLSQLANRNITVPDVTDALTAHLCDALGLRDVRHAPYDPAPSPSAAGER